jgi:hypothetical protein
MTDSKKIGSSKPSSSGGVIQYTNRGLIHISGKRYSGLSAEIVASQARKNAQK